MVVKVEKKLIQVLDLCRRGRLVLGRDETVVASVGVQGRQNDANELNAHWLSVGFCILFLSVFSILVLFLVCNILHICGFPSTLSHSTRHFTEVDSLPTLARRLRTSPSSNLQLNRYAKKSSGAGSVAFMHYVGVFCHLAILLTMMHARALACVCWKMWKKNRVKQQQRPKAGFFQKKLTIGCCWPRGLSRPLVIHHYSSGESGRS
ncbi:hypothetical protein T09_15003 [Trichinella sp. T9]|nr:hypothetical protein T09_15003 [Trichinella sp. T9]